MTGGQLKPRSPERGRISTSEVDRSRVGTIPQKGATDLSDPLVFSRRDEGVDLGNLVAKLLPVSLDEASGGHDAGVGRLAGDFQEGVDRFFPGRFDESTGVDQDDVGVVGTFGRDETFEAKTGQESLGVDEVLRTAETDQGNFGL